MKPMSPEMFAGRDVSILLNERAASRGDHPFLVWNQPGGATRRWTYAEFRDQVAELAGGLAARGVKRGDRVLVQLENCPELLLTWFACAWLGAVCAPCNVAATGDELGWLAALTGASCGVTQPSLRDNMCAHCPGLLWVAVTGGHGVDTASSASGLQLFSFDALFSDRVEPTTADPEALAAIMFTSGTTARPKAVSWTHANVLWGAKLGAMQQGLHPGDIYQVFLPLFHVVGLSWGVLSTLWVGGTVVLQQRFSASGFWPVAIAHGCTISSHVQFTTGVLMGQPVPPGHRFRQWGASMWTPEQEAHFGIRILGWWGMTELVTQGVIGDPFLSQTARSIGRPSIGIAIRIVDNEGRPAGPGSPGHLHVRGRPGLSIFASYYNDEEASAAAYTDDGWFITGDLVVRHADGSIEFAERTKDVIKVGGENVSAAEVERVVATLPGVLECAAVARQDDLYGEVVVLFVSLGPGGPEHAVQAILDHCRTRLSKYKVPREVIVLESLPRIGVGKIAKSELRGRLRRA